MLFWLSEGNNGMNCIKLVSYFSTTLWHAAPKQHYQSLLRIKHVYMYLFHCSFTVFFYFHNYIAQILYVLTEKTNIQASPSWKATRPTIVLLVTQSLPLMQPAVHWRRNCLPPVIFSQTNTIRASNILNIHFKVILPSTPKYSK